MVVEGATVGQRHLVSLDAGRDELVITAGEQPVLLMLIGGGPFDEEVIM